MAPPFPFPGQMRAAPQWLHKLGPLAGKSSMLCPPVSAGRALLPPIDVISLGLVNFWRMMAGFYSSASGTSVSSLPLGGLRLISEVKVFLFM